MDALLFVLWIGLSVFTWYMAGTRGREGIVWFLIALVFSPLIALIILLLLPNRATPTASAAATGEEVRKCPMCAEWIKREAIKCRYCGTSLDAAPPRDDAAPAQSADADAQMKYGG